MSSLLGNNKRDFYVEVAKGKIPGHSVVNKFGISGTITTADDPQDIIQQGGSYTFTANTGADYYFSSSDNSDTQEIVLVLLTVDSNDNWNQEIITQSLVGQTKTLIVTDSGDPVVRILRAYNNDSTDFAGTVYIYEDDTVVAGVPQTASNIRAIMTGNYNQTQLGIYTIPTGYVAFLTRGEIGLQFSGSVGAGNNFATATYYSRLYGKVFRALTTLSLLTSATSMYTDWYPIPGAIPAKTDIKPTIDEVSDDMAAVGKFQFMLVEEKYLDDDFLTSIGQIKRVS